jgi:hypothetical protein
VDAIGVMVELGASVGAVTEHPTLETPLHIAARCGRLDVLEKLLKCRLDVLARTKVRRQTDLECFDGEVKGCSTCWDGFAACVQTVSELALFSRMGAHPCTMLQPLGNPML